MSTRRWARPIGGPASHAPVRPARGAPRRSSAPLLAARCSRAGPLGLPIQRPDPRGRRLDDRVLRPGWDGPWGAPAHDRGRPPACRSRTTARRSRSCFTAISPKIRVVTIADGTFIDIPIPGVDLLAEEAVGWSADGRSIVFAGLDGDHERAVRCCRRWIVGDDADPGPAQARRGGVPARVLPGQQVDRVRVPEDPTRPSSRRCTSSTRTGPGCAPSGPPQARDRRRRRSPCGRPRRASTGLPT